MAALIMFTVCGQAMAYTVELDPITPLDNYISLGEWNTEGDFEDWTTFLVNDSAVYNGSITGRVVGADMNISLDVSALPNNDVRKENLFVTGSVYEIRLRFDPFTETTRSEFFPTMDGSFKVPPITFASNADPALPDIENDGLFHVYRITLDTNDTLLYLGQLDGIRFDALDDLTSNETFEVDYFRIADTTVAPVPPAPSFIVELDPSTPLDNYVSLGDWNTNDEFEDWTTRMVNDAAVYDGSITGLVVGNDMNISLNIIALSSNDVRVGNVMVTGSVYEIRVRFDQYTECKRSEFFPTMNGIFKFPPIMFANNDDFALPDIEGDGLFHVYRITLLSNFYLGKLDAIRFDILDDFGSNETFEVDYFRIANVITNVPFVDPITVDGELLSNYTSLAEWDTDDDIENWQMVNITNETVSGGIFSGRPLNADPWFYKISSLGLPQVDLADAPYAEFRLKQVSSITDSEIEIFFTTTNNPGMSGEMRASIPASKIPHDGEFHVYRYQMSQNPLWEGVLDGFRIDPYTVDTTEKFEIDYIRVGDLIPEPTLLLGIILAGIAVFRKRL